MKAFFKELFEYSHNYNQKLWEVFDENQGQVTEKASNLFNHMLNAHQIWNNRIDPKEMTPAVWELRPLIDLKDIDMLNYHRSLAIVDTFDFDKEISYATSTGIPFKNNVRDILFHVVNHSTYHRGQIAMDFRQSGLDPLITDYIFYKR
ncbi:MAG: DinB family protein [Bacteroidota bacterium]